MLKFDLHLQRLSTGLFLTPHTPRDQTSDALHPPFPRQTSGAIHLMVPWGMEWVRRGASTAHTGEWSTHEEATVSHAREGGLPHHVTPEVRQEKIMPKTQNPRIHSVWDCPPQGGTPHQGDKHNIVQRTKINLGESILKNTKTHKLVCAFLSRWTQIFFKFYFYFTS